MIKSLLKTYLVITGLMLLGYSSCLYFFFHSRDKMEDISADSYSVVLQKQEPLSANKYMEALKIPSLKEKSAEVMRTYNRRVQLIQIIRERMELLKKFNRLSPEAESVVNRNINLLEKDNSKIKKQFDSIAAFAEKQYAASLRDQYSPDIEDKARLYTQENDALLKEVDLPVSFK